MMGEYYSGNTITANNDMWQNYTINLDYITDTSTALYTSPKPPTNMDWLNKRVDEMRVRL